MVFEGTGGVLSDDATSHLNSQLLKINSIARRLYRVYMRTNNRKRIQRAEQDCY
jgi:hypothetical protein